ncbi:ly6/PLAUR domain-containing protein 6B-like [Megalops cyprinoides]|uniref:ly6/PLAUR domain-containing protein 6B-like n=1 Tax=Megalops cyprinoides TaxID=118141 RepID=UPI001864B29C|nr:ly6/PLAUR domain-containing protein 6B-like [Megalops cyprinoides]
MSVSTALHHTVALQVLLVIAMCDEGQANRINFYNVIPPVDATPFPKSFKCFTCEHALDNYNCNRWAEDKWCPQNTQFCMTVHHFTSRGKTKSVTKRCVSREDCHAVGCHHHRDAGHTECISCCEGMVCNVDVPTNHSNAVFALRQAHSSSAPPNWSWSISSLLASVVTLRVLLS